MEHLQGAFWYDGLQPVGSEAEVEPLQFLDLDALLSGGQGTELSAGPAFHASPHPGGAAPSAAGLQGLLPTASAGATAAAAGQGQQQAAPGTAAAGAALKKKGKGGRKPLTAEEKAARAEREREQNRVMQARYRARQKERRQQVEEQHEAASQDLERLRQEHSSLTHMNSILEALLAVRDTTLGVLEGAKAAELEEPQEQQPPPPLRAFSPNRVQQLLQRQQEQRQLEQQERQQRQQQQQQQGGQGGQPYIVELASSASEEQLLGARSSGGSSARGEPPAGPGLDGVRISDGRAGGSGSRDGSFSGEGSMQSGASYSSANASGCGAGGCGGPGSSGDGACGSFAGGPLGCSASIQQAVAMAAQQAHEEHDEVDWFKHRPVDAATIAELKSVTPEQYIKSFQSFVQNIRDILNEYELTKHEHVDSQIKSVMDSHGCLMTLMLQHNPACVQRLFASSADHGLTEEEEQRKWDAAVSRTQVTPAQRERHLRLHQAYTEKVERLRAHRAQAVTLIRQASMDGMSAAGGLSGMMSQYLAVMEAAQRLSSYPESEFTALLEFMGDSGRIFTPVQKARLLSCAYPHFPDVLQVVEAVRRLPSTPGTAEPS